MRKLRARKLSRKRKAARSLLRASSTTGCRQLRLLAVTWSYEQVRACLEEKNNFFAFTVRRESPVSYVWPFVCHRSSVTLAPALSQDQGPGAGA